MRVTGCAVVGIFPGRATVITPAKFPDALFALHGFYSQEPSESFVTFQVFYELTHSISERFPLIWCQFLIIQGKFFRL